MKAYVLMQSEVGHEASIIDALQSVKEIINIHSIYGIYDIIIEMEADSKDRIKEVTLNKVRRIDHVKSTIMLITYGESVINE